MQRVLLAFTLLTAISMSCRKNSDNNADSFPAETQEGKNTLGCYINDTAFISGTILFGQVRPVNVSYYRDSTTYYKAGFLSIGGIDARYFLDIAGDIVINKLQVFGPGEYNLQHVANCGSNYGCDDIGYHNAKTNKTYFAESGKLIITKLDTINNIVSGRFNFVAKDTTGNRIQITNGRFDAKYLN